MFTVWIFGLIGTLLLAYMLSERFLPELTSYIDEEDLEESVSEIPIKVVYWLLATVVAFLWFIVVPIMIADHYLAKYFNK